MAVLKFLRIFDVCNKCYPKTVLDYTYTLNLLRNFVHFKFVEESGKKNENYILC